MCNHRVRSTRTGRKVKRQKKCKMYSMNDRQNSQCFSQGHVADPLF